MIQRSFLLILLPLLALQGCLGGNRKEADERPAELVRIADVVPIRSVWSAKLGGDAEHLRLGLAPASDGTRVFAASHSGSVSGFDVVTGKRDWRTDTGLQLTAGPGYGAGLVVVGSADGDVVTLDATNGVERWRAAVTGELLAVPVIFGRSVIVRSVSGEVIVLEADSGKLRWRAEQPVPRLSLRGVGQPAAAADRVVVGFDNGRVIAYRLRDGAELWQVPLASRRGRTELERLSDVDSNVLIIGEEVYIAGFQSRAALVSLDDGQGAWVQDLSSVGGLAADWNAVYSTGAEGRVVALERASGERKWEQSGLLRRGVTGPEAFGDGVVVGDFEGYVHWLSAGDGSIVGRGRAGKARIAATPLAVGNRLFVQDEAGVLHAFVMPETGDSS